MSCPLGKLYNKEAIISFLLNPPNGTHDPGPYGNDGQLVASHIRSLKDIITLNLTPNPALDKGTGGGNHQSSHYHNQYQAAAASEATFGTTESKTPASYVCPISLREMNGSIKFIYRKPCGCVMSESSMKEMRKFGQQTTQGSAAAGKDATADSESPICPVDAAHSQGVEEWVTINPIGEELQSMKEAWELRKLQEKEAKKLAKERKRKDKDNGSTKDGITESEPKAKKKKTSSAAPSAAQAIPSIKAGATVPLLSASLAAKIAEQKKAHSPAIASLYAKKGGDDNHVGLGRRSTSRCFLTELL